MLMGMLDRLFRRKRKGISDPEQREDSYEFCPRCEANLTLQRGYDPALPYWICRGCGEMLINPLVETDTDIAWICDGCGAMLNIQEGFREGCGKWSCSECGHENRIDQSELYFSEDEYRMELRNPYRGLSDDAILILSLYREEKELGGKDNILLVQNVESGRYYVKKLLSDYNKSVYDHLKKHPIAKMPCVYEVFESENHLIVLEEYVEGRTILELLEEGPLSEKQAVYILKELCKILKELHSLPTPLIHRDIKPSNIILTPEDEVYLLDMNVAKWYDAMQKDDTRYLGTKHYAAPEQVGYGLSASSVKSDIYAAGVLFNVMLTGSYPKGKRAPERYWAIIEKCIDLRASERFTAEELLEELKFCQPV